MANKTSIFFLLTCIFFFTLSPHPANSLEYPEELIFQDQAFTSTVSLPPSSDYYSTFSPLSPSSSPSPSPSSDTESEIPFVPALFVIGDSSVDAGNNNFLGTFARADRPPYGRDFDTHTPTGRFSNGRIPVDYLALRLGLPFVPNYLESAGSIEGMIHGVNYASAGAGIIFASGSDLGQRISFAQQIQRVSDTFQQFKMSMGEDVANNLISSSLYSPVVFFTLLSNTATTTCTVPLPAADNIICASTNPSFLPGNFTLVIHSAIVKNTTSLPFNCNSFFFTKKTQERNTLLTTTNNVYTDNIIFGMVMRKNSGAFLPNIWQFTTLFLALYCMVFLIELADNLEEAEALAEMSKGGGE